MSREDIDVCGHSCCGDPGDPHHVHLLSVEDCTGCEFVSRLDAARERKSMTTTAHSLLPSHCAFCGVDWPKSHNGRCRSCKVGLPCRADTTDTVAPDPPCAGSRARRDPSGPKDAA